MTATYLVLFSNKQSHLFTEQLIADHIQFLKSLHSGGHLVLCGPFSDNQGAALIIKAHSKLPPPKN